jgi:hypothetical protein
MDAMPKQIKTLRATMLENCLLLVRLGIFFFWEGLSLQAKQRSAPPKKPWYFFFPAFWREKKSSEFSCASLAPIKNR